jgi:hypothetical protein
LWPQLRRSWKDIRQDAFDQRLALFQATPSGGQVEHGAVTGSAQKGSAEKHLSSQRERLAIPFQAAGSLKLTQQIEEHQNAAEGCFRGEELAQAEVVGGQVVFQIPQSGSPRRLAGCNHAKSLPVEPPRW